MLITSFGPWALPQRVQKFYSIRSQADVKRAMITSTVFALFMSLGAYYTGSLTHLFFTDPKTDLAPIIDAATGKPSIPIAGAIAMIVPMIVMPVVSLMTQPPSAATVEKAFAADVT